MLANVCMTDRYTYMPYSKVHYIALNDCGVKYIQAPSDFECCPQVLACAPASCMSRGCPGYEFSSIGLTACGIDVTAPIGTVYTINFTVLDNGRPPLRASVIRVVTIVNPCGSDFMCDDGICSSSIPSANASVLTTTCEERERLRKASTAPLNNPPKVTLHPLEWRSGDAFPEADASANRTMYLMYQQVNCT